MFRIRSDVVIFLTGNIRILYYFIICFEFGPFEWENRNSGILGKKSNKIVCYNAGTVKGKLLKMVFDSVLYTCFLTILTNLPTIYILVVGPGGGYG